MIKTRSGQDLALPEGRAAGRYIKDLIFNNGTLPDSNGDDALDWKEFYPVLLRSEKEAQDLISLPNVSQTLSTTVEMIMSEPVMPISNIPLFFNEIRTQHLTTQIMIGAIGFHAEADDVPEQGNYPEVDFTFGGGMQVSTVGKAGIQIAFTEEALKYSSWDLFGMNMRAMRNALWRHKAFKGINFMLSLGVTLFDNLNPTNSLYGILKGRGMDGAANGSLDSDSLLKAIAHMHQEGYLPDTLLVSPMHFYTWIQDPVLRTLFVNGNGGSYFNMYSGNPGPLAPFSNGSIGKLGEFLGNRITPYGSPSGAEATGIGGREHGMTATFNLPGYFPVTLKIVVDPSVPFDAERNLGHMILVSSGNVGAIFIDEDVKEIQWEDISRERKMMRLRERYAYGVFNEGQAIGILKNIPAVPNYFPGVINYTSLEVLEEIDADASLSL